MFSFSFHAADWLLLLLDAHFLVVVVAFVAFVIVVIRSSYVSVLTIVAFSTERFLAICFPLHLYAMSGFKRAVRIIATLWIISFISAVPFGCYSKIHYIQYPPGECVFHFFHFLTFLFGFFFRSFLVFDEFSGRFKLECLERDLILMIFKLTIEWWG